MSQSKRWCFTINNYSSAEFTRLQQLDQDIVKYLIVGKEVGEQGTPHLQGYAVFFSNYRLSGVKRLISQRGNFRVARGSSEQNRKYCSKEENFFELGVCPESDGGQREKRKWDEIRRAAEKGDFKSIPDDVFIRNYVSIRAIAKDNLSQPTDADGTTGIWIHGEAGIGKSRYARYNFPDFYDKPINKWWDGYQQQPHVLIDDFGPDHAVLGHHLKRWADRYSFPAEIKGGGLQIRPKKVIVTSQYSIDQIWSDAETRAALTRRFHVIHLTTPWEEPKPNEEPSTPCPTPNEICDDFTSLINNLFA